MEIQEYKVGAPDSTVLGQALVLLPLVALEK